MVDFVADLRVAQKSYFKTKDRFYLVEAKRLERELDKAILYYQKSFQSPEGECGYPINWGK